jgi:molybdopterin biosynthesis enzyme
MDGIALFARDSFGATDTTPVTLRPEQFTEVDTGDPIPEGCDAVIMVEELVKNDDGSVTIHAPAAPWQHIRQIGEDVCAGEMILPSFMEITPAAIGAMIAGGVLVGVGVVSQIVCAPLIVVGKKKMHQSAETYNASCRYSQMRMQPQPYWSLQTSANGVGFAFNF